MLTVMPDHYPRFRCIAGACRHSCCVGWEIDIDPESYLRYQNCAGAMGARLAEHIAPGDPPCFRLTDTERCPFLNAAGLCQLILYGGEDFLCQICTDHPRFRNFLPDRTEVGLGLCCEAAGALLLRQKEPMQLLYRGQVEAEPEPETAFLLRLRASLIALAQDRTKPLDARMAQMQALCHVSLPEADWPAVFLALERLDAGWTPLLEALQAAPPGPEDCVAFARHMASRETEYEQLLVYFLYRHFLSAREDGDVGSKLNFAILSVQFLRRLGALVFSRKGAFLFADQVELARMYSGEIEYSQENLDTLFDLLA